MENVQPTRQHLLLHSSRRGKGKFFHSCTQLESVERVRGMHVAAAEASAPGAGSGAGGERVVCGFRVRALTGLQTSLLFSIEHCIYNLLLRLHKFTAITGG